MGSNEKYEYVFDETVENQRLAGQHQAFKLGMGKLVLAPLQVSQKNLRILDAGTSDGTLTSVHFPLGKEGVVTDI
jgi:tRNA1(Val) A37 N6-methylase TrmN6